MLSFETDYRSYPINLDPAIDEVTIGRYRIHEFKA